MLRRMMLRRKTDEHRRQTYTLCEPAQSKCTSTCHKSHAIRKFTGKMPQTRVSTQTRHRPLHLPMGWDGMGWDGMGWDGMDG